MMVEAVLTDSDFSDGKLSKLIPYTLVLVHASLSPDDRSAAQTLFETALRVAQGHRQLVIDGIEGGAIGRAAAVDRRDYAAIATPVTSAQAVNA
jgi:hypothetical protein